MFPIEANLFFKCMVISYLFKIKVATAEPQDKDKTKGGVRVAKVAQTIINSSTTFLK